MILSRIRYKNKKIEPMNLLQTYLRVRLQRTKKVGRNWSKIRLIPVRFFTPVNFNTKLGKSATLILVHFFCDNYFLFAIK